MAVVRLRSDKVIGLAGILIAGIGLLQSKDYSEPETVTLCASGTPSTVDSQNLAVLTI